MQGGLRRRHSQQEPNSEMRDEAKERNNEIMWDGEGASAVNHLLIWCVEDHEWRRDKAMWWQNWYWKLQGKLCCIKLTLTSWYFACNRHFRCRTDLLDIISSAELLYWKLNCFSKWWPFWNMYPNSPVRWSQAALYCSGYLFQPFKLLVNYFNSCT